MLVSLIETLNYTTNNRDALSKSANKNHSLIFHIFPHMFRVFVLIIYKIFVDNDIKINRKASIKFLPLFKLILK